MFRGAVNVPGFHCSLFLCIGHDLWNKDEDSELAFYTFEPKSVGLRPHCEKKTYAWWVSDGDQS